MAKSQKRTSRETKKPKAVKAPTLATSNLMAKGVLAPTGGFAKKKK